MLVSDVIAYCKSFHNAAVRRARLAAASAPTKVYFEHSSALLFSALHAQQSCQWSVVFATLLQSGKDATTSGKAAASQLSKGSRKSKAKSGVSTIITSILHAADTNRLVCHTHHHRTRGISPTGVS